MKDTCLAICARPISLNASQAGDKCAYHFIRDLAETFDVELFLLINKNDTIHADLADELGVKKLSIYRIGRFEKLYLIAINFLKGIPPRYGSRFKNSILTNFQEIIASGDYQQIYYEFSQCASYHVALPDKIHSVLSIHDVQIQVSLRAKALEAFLFSWLTYCFEKRLFMSLNKLIVLCDKDKKLIEGLYQHADISIRPPPLSDFVAHVKRTSATIKTHTILFWGALARPENEEAAWFLAKTLFPEIKKQFPDSKLYLVGSNPSPRILKISSESIIVTGFVDDPTPFFMLAHIGVVPLTRGAGIKLKTLEMLACNIPVITTEIGAEGISENPLLIVDSLDNFLGKIVGLFNNKSWYIENSH